MCMKNADAAAMWAAGMELTALLKGMKLNVTIEELQHLLYINAPPGGRLASISTKATRQVSVPRLSHEWTVPC